jgi:GNAT superfamily N-acetyltransferase
MEISSVFSKRRPADEPRRLLNTMQSDKQAEHTDAGGIGIDIRAVGPEPGLAGALADVLIDCVEGGASVSFMLPLEHQRAEAFWTSTLESAQRGERLVFVAEERFADGEPGSGEVVGTVQVILTAPENQPHRGEIAKMLVHRRARRRGVADALMRAAEAAALSAGKSLLVLDTSSGDAERVYLRLGWQRVGVIPSYAMWPNGGFVDTTVFYKHLTATEGG